MNKRKVISLGIVVAVVTLLYKYEDRINQGEQIENNKTQAKIEIQNDDCVKNTTKYVKYLSELPQYDRVVKKFPDSPNSLDFEKYYFSYFQLSYLADDFVENKRMFPTRVILDEMLGVEYSVEVIISQSKCNCDKLIGIYDSFMMIYEFTSMEVDFIKFDDYDAELDIVFRANCIDCVASPESFGCIKREMIPDMLSDSYSGLYSIFD